MVLSGCALMCWFDRIGRPPSTALSYAPGEEGVAVDLERACFGFTGRAPECVDGWSDGDVVEPAVFEHLLPASTGQPSGNSTGPQIDVSHRLDRDGAAVGHVGELLAHHDPSTSIPLSVY